MKLNKKYELEDVYLYNGELYGQVYHSYTKTSKKKVTVSVTVRRKSEKTGKFRKKKIRKTITVKKQKFIRKNYLFSAK